MGPRSLSSGTNYDTSVRARNALLMPGQCCAHRTPLQIGGMHTHHTHYTRTHTLYYRCTTCYTHMYTLYHIHITYTTAQTTYLPYTNYTHTILHIHHIHKQHISHTQTTHTHYTTDTPRTIPYMYALYHIHYNTNYIPHLHKLHTHTMCAEVEAGDWLQAGVIPPCCPVSLTCVVCGHERPPAPGHSTLVIQERETLSCTM